MITVKDFASLHLSENECDDFADWAFGAHYEEYKRSKDLISSWNFRHSEKYRVYPYGKISEDIVEMVKIWKEEHGK